MQFNGTFASIRCTHNIANVTHTLGEVLVKNLWPNLTPMCDLPYGEGETTSLMGPKAYKTNNLFLIVR
jgi:hypothetical protein